MRGASKWASTNSGVPSGHYTPRATVPRRDVVPASLGRVEAEPSPLEGMHVKAAVEVMHTARRGEDVCVIQERYCIPVGARVGLQIAKKRQREQPLPLPLPLPVRVTQTTVLSGQGTTVGDVLIV